MLPLKSTKIKFFISLGVAIIITIAYGIFFTSISSTNKALGMLDYELESEVNVEAQLKLLNNVIKETENERDILSSYFISSDGVVAFINEMESVAKSVDTTPEIIFVSIKDQLVAGAVDEFEVLNLEIQVEGEWSAVFHFAKLLDLMPYYINVNRMSLDNVPLQGEEIGPSPIWTGIFNVDILKQK